MCRIETDASPATTATRYDDNHERLTSAGLRTPRKGSMNIQNNSRRGKVQNPSGEHLHANIDRHAGHSVREGHVVDQPHCDSWKVVYPKRRRRVKKPIIVDHSDDELINNEDYLWLVNRFGEISAQDALASIHDNESCKLHAFKLLEGEAHMPDPTGAVI